METLELSNGEELTPDKKIKTNGVCFAVLTLTAVLLLPEQLGAQEPALNIAGHSAIVIRGATQGEPVIPHVFDGDLRNLPLTGGWKQSDPVIEIPKRIYPRTDSEPGVKNGSFPANDVVKELSDFSIAKEREPGVPAVESPDGLHSLPESGSNLENTQDQIELRNFSVPDLNFEGQSFTGVYPPDTVGEVGPNHYIQMVNASGGTIVNVYDKSGNHLAGPVNLDALWTAGGACAFGRGDPIVLYDTLADRWLLSEFAASGNHLCVYISQTADPLGGGWYLYDFPTPSFPDYPKYAVWPDAYYVSSNESSPAAYALDRSKMLNGLPATSQRFTAPSLPAFGFQALIPSDLDGSSPPPAGAPNYFMRHRDGEVNGDPSDPFNDRLEIWEFRVDWNNPANSTFTGPINILVSDFDSDLCGLFSFSCFPQPGTGITLDPLREVIMWRLQYRNFGTHETLVGNFVTDVDGTDHGGIRWFELRKSAGNWALFQEGTYSPDSHHRWMGSIAMDQAGNIALGYSVSSSTLFASIRYTGRLASDPLGTLPQGETTLINGSGSQTGITRWGDYSAMSVDPVDDCTFWYTNEYMPSSGLWHTRIGSFKFPSCSSTANPNPDIKANGSDGPIAVAPGDNLLVTVALDSGSYANTNADWWVLAHTSRPPPNDWYHYDPNSGWVPGLSCTLQYPLFDLAPFEVLNISGLISGTYTVYFGVDLNVNCIIDDPLFYDAVEVNQQ